ncbi:hypothetical protein CVM52_11295 [Pseudooceanicola lipolyticus]|uniref:Uncharacterized protein n=1 Tax=Pseudooceanicola lipolyticus TaxID=2029104 RepID=A0A2M8J1C6_9RHOB|nr:hypothetical protein [Pseudooceanicola lipolyticus]PJE36575.1 hypothetical protein CVM52_11295 [Pseudooceanicola lipolyticus]
MTAQPFMGAAMKYDKYQALDESDRMVARLSEMRAVWLGSEYAPVSHNEPAPLDRTISRIARQTGTSEATVSQVLEAYQNTAEQRG